MTTSFLKTGLDFNMIPKIIHFCWFGRGEMPPIALQCLDSWHKYMPDWDYHLWNEDSFDVTYNRYTREAYDAKKYAFVSDVARLKALVDYGGIYLDTDVLVFKSFDPLLKYRAFAGFEGSKYSPIGTCVLASEKKGVWVCEQLHHYDDRQFIKEDGSFDMTTNVTFISTIMKKNGFVANGIEQDYKDLHILPVDYFCPRHTTGEYLRTENTFCDHLGIGSWENRTPTWKTRILSLVSPSMRAPIIKLKRILFG